MSNQETFSDYDIVRAMDYLNLTKYVEWEFEWAPVQPTEFLVVGFDDLRRQITPGSNEWEQRPYIELIFMESLRNRNLKMWQERTIDVGESPLRGKFDFAITAYQIAFRTPFVVMIEAKKENFDLGWGQCLMAMKTAQQLNEQEGHSFDVYGIVSSGRIWEFGKLSLDNQFHKTSNYTLTQPELVLGILNYIFSECERNLTPA